MDTLNLPTKKNLLLARQRLALARKGYDLLDKKRQVLVSELATVHKQARQIWDRLCLCLNAAYGALQILQAEIGHERALSISSNMRISATIQVYFRSIMGVEVPVISPGDTICEGNRLAYDACIIPYPLHKTTVSMDEAVLAWNNALELIVSWAAIENTRQQLNIHIKKTQKRANALANITIPNYEVRIKYIQERLEERERDELARLKKLV